MTGVKIGMSKESHAVIDKHGERAPKIRAAISDGVDQILVETENHLKINYLSGRYTGAKRGGQPPLALRSGMLRQAATHKRDEPFSGFVGFAKGPASRYAAVVAGNGTWIIKPKKATYLWIPIADNLSKSGQTRMTPREAMAIVDAKGKRLLQIFKSKKGNIVAFLPNFQQDDEGVATRTGDKFQRGDRKGRTKGKLLFVLKKSVTVVGTDALGRAAEDKRPRFKEIIQKKILGAVA